MSTDPAATPTIVIQQPKRRWLTPVLLLLLTLSLLLNLGLLAVTARYFEQAAGPSEKFVSGEATASDKIALIELSGTIMPPFTEHYLKAIERAAEDDAVKGVLLSIDSPGGLVADSHQIYHRLKKLAETKPIAVSFSRMAASGGYYVAMGAGPQGRIFAEPTTWTGSIGVIIPYYNAAELAKSWGIESDPLKTGQFKDALNPLRELSQAERDVWEKIIDDAFARFKRVIDENRAELDAEEVATIATGQVFTATQALENGLIDEVGFQEDAIESLKKDLGLSNVRVVTYQRPLTLMEVVLGLSSARQQMPNPLDVLLDSSVPRAFYHCGWHPSALGSSAR